MEFKIASYGLLSVAGVLSLLLGSMMLFKGSSPDLRVSWRIIFPTFALVSGFFVVVAGLVFRAQISKPRTGAGGLAGETGVVRQAIDPEGKVFVHGELWNARSTLPLQVGTKVRVVKVTGLVIEVEPLET